MDNEAPSNTIQVIREPFLIRNPWFSITLVMIFYFLFQLIPQLIYSYLIVKELVTFRLYVSKIIDFLSLAILLLLFIPFLRIPNDNRSYKQYMKDTQLSEVSGKGMLVSFITILVLFVLAYGAVYLSAVLSRLYYIRYVEELAYLEYLSPQVVWNPSYLFDPNAFLNVYYALTPGIMEEIAFRGIILVLLLKKYQWKKAVVLDGVLFGLFHLVNLFGPTLSYVNGAYDLDYYLAILRNTGFQVIYATCLGIVWAFLFVKSKSLLPCILAHWLIDAFGGLVLNPNIINPWIYFICITALGIGILPAILDILIIKGFYRNPPWEEEEKVVFR